MAQQNLPEQRPTTVAGRGTERLIEKGWTVYDALQHPLGIVHDVDAPRNRMIVDGRPVGFTTFEILLDSVGQTSGNEVHLTRVIEDSGPGLTVEQQDRLFEAFYTTKAGGTGLGLAVTKTLLEKMGATIRSGNGARGARFEVLLPTEQVA